MPELPKIRNAVISGVGAYAPPAVVSNDALAAIVDTNDEWIRTRTGIHERRIAAASEKCSDIAEKAARAALENSGVKPEEIDLLIVATITADTRTPSTACWIQPRLGLINAAAFDISAACSGFVYALDIARQYIGAGAAKHVLIVGAEKMSDIIDWADRGTCVIFGDGAGAAVISAGTEGGSRGILSTAIGSDGAGAMLIRMEENLEAPGAALEAAPDGSLRAVAGRADVLKMEGNKVFVSAVRGMSDVAFKAIKLAGLTLADIAVVVPHQANTRIIDTILEKMGVPHERAVINIDRFGNTTAASIPLALDEAARGGRIKDGDYVLLMAFGAGLTWGASVIQWGK